MADLLQGAQPCEAPAKDVSEEAAKDTFEEAAKDTSEEEAKDQSEEAAMEACERCLGMVETVAVEVNDAWVKPSLNVVGRDLHGAMCFGVTATFNEGERIMPQVSDPFADGLVEVNTLSQHHIVKAAWGPENHSRYSRHSAKGYGWGTYMMEGEEFQCPACGNKSIFREAHLQEWNGRRQRCRRDAGPSHDAGSGSASTSG